MRLGFQIIIAVSGVLSLYLVLAIVHTVFHVPKPNQRLINIFAPMVVGGIVGFLFIPHNPGTGLKIAIIGIVAGIVASLTTQRGNL